MPCKPPCQRNLHHPEAYEIDVSGREGVAGPVKGLQKDRGEGKHEVAGAEEPKAFHPGRDHRCVVRKQCDQRMGKQDEKQTDGAEKHEIQQAGPPHGASGAIRLAGPDILPYQRGGGVTQTEGGQKNEADDA